MKDTQDATVAATRDAFLSHRSTDKPFVRQLAADLESTYYADRTLLTWLDEAEIRPGQSAVGAITLGLETSRFFCAILTPGYFNSPSGWTDAEWHSALTLDPDNRRGRIIPILAENCPYIPALLRNLTPIDMRANRYATGLGELVRILREEPLPRPTAHRGQLIGTSRTIDRATLVAERSVVEAHPDSVPEHLFCNLLPVEQLPLHIYSAPVRKPGTKRDLIQAIREAQDGNSGRRIITPAFRLHQGQIVTFHDLEAPESLFEPIIDEDHVSVEPTGNLLAQEDERRRVVSLLNMAIDRHAQRVGLEIDRARDGRYFFPPAKGGKESVITWKPVRKTSRRTVAKPCMGPEGETRFWRHQAAYIRMIFVGSAFYVHINPTWVLTDDGHQVKSGPRVSRLVNRWTLRERNLHVLYHVRFWTSVLRRGPGPIKIRAGDQLLQIGTTPAMISLSAGIAWDQNDLMGLLDSSAPTIAQLEEERTESLTDAALDPLRPDANEDEQVHT